MSCARFHEVAGGANAMYDATPACLRFPTPPRALRHTPQGIDPKHIEDIENNVLDNGASRCRGHVRRNECA